MVIICVIRVLGPNDLDDHMPKKIFMNQVVFLRGALFLPLPLEVK